MGSIQSSSEQVCPAASGLKLRGRSSIELDTRRPGDSSSAASVSTTWCWPDLVAVHGGGALRWTRSCLRISSACRVSWTLSSLSEPQAMRARGSGQVDFTGSSAVVCNLLRLCPWESNSLDWRGAWRNTSGGVEGEGPWVPADSCRRPHPGRWSAVRDGQWESDSDDDWVSPLNDLNGVGVRETFWRDTSHMSRSLLAAKLMPSVWPNPSPVRQLQALRVASFTGGGPKFGRTCSTSNA
mmetsp:Transcript_37822/g.100660  ORF Transcript_37822/g.100660 Transcript_37822/m.100660 type:complete len:239 (+) Transcript_37822:218-934(+)